MKSVSRKIIAMLLAVLMVVGFAACGGTTEKEQGVAPAANEETKPAESAGKDKIAFIVADMANESQAFASKMFKKHGEEYNFDVILLDSKGDAQTETTNVNNAVAQGVKALFVNPNDIKAIVPALEAAKKAGVIVGLFSSDLAQESQAARDFFVGVDDVAAGQAAAKAFTDAFPDGVRVVEIGGQSGHDAQIKRHDGFNNAIKGTKIEVIDYKACQQWSSEQAMAIMEDMLTKNGDKIQGVFCHWDNGVSGILSALKTANKTDLFIVGVDGNRAGYDQVKQGLQSVSIAQNFETMSVKSLELARKVIDGEKVEQVNFIPFDLYTKDSVEKFSAPEW